MVKYILLTLLLSVILLSTCTSGVSDTDITVKDPWVRAAGKMKMEGNDQPEMGSQVHAGDMGANTAAYMVLENNGNQADKLISASSDAADVVELHESKMENNVMKMQTTGF